MLLITFPTCNTHMLDLCHIILQSKSDEFDDSIKNSWFYDWVQQSQHWQLSIFY